MATGSVGDPLELPGGARLSAVPPGADDGAALAKELSADAGYCTEDNLKELSRRHIRGYVATGRRKHEDGVAQGLPHGAGPRALAMRPRLRRGGHRSRYRLRKQTAEPVIGVRDNYSRSARDLMNHAG